MLKNQKEILSKLGIKKLNPMQEEARLAIHSSPEVVLLSPTGSGKTVAFLLPIVQALSHKITEVQTLILVPSRELAIQIEHVLREMGTGYKSNAVYGGRPFSKDKMDLKHRPAILIGTPGRVADHLRRGTFSADLINTLVLDEYDKSLEVGFEEEMSEIFSYLTSVRKKVLTSATEEEHMPAFLEIDNPIRINYLSEGVAQLKIKSIVSPDKDKLETLARALNHLGHQPGIIFCNFKDSIHRISDFLAERGIEHGCYYGGLEQIDRERCLIKFRNGTHQLILATDLAARGLDIPELKFIIHYHLPMRSHEFSHRNGRTARMNADGTAYVIKWVDEELPDFIGSLDEEFIRDAERREWSEWGTVFISGGRKDKISKGDIAGFLFKQCDLNKEEVGIIELKNDCAFVAIHTSRIEFAIDKLDNARIKKRKIRAYEI